MKAIFYVDPGHGYLRVPMKKLEEFGVKFKISPYSFKSERYAYLEEDLDANTFINAVEATGEKVELVVKYLDHDAGCRRYERFPETMGYLEYRNEMMGV